MHTPRRNQHTRFEPNMLPPVRFSPFPGVPDSAPDILRGRTVADWLENAYCNACTHELLRTGTYRLFGWQYTFVMPMWLYKRYGNWYEAYAPSVRLLRAALKGGGPVDRVIPLPTPGDTHYEAVC